MGIILRQLTVQYNDGKKYTRQDTRYRLGYLAFSFNQEMSCSLIKVISSIWFFLFHFPHICRKVYAPEASDT